MIAPRPATAALCAVLDAEAKWLLDQLVLVVTNRQAIETGSLREMRVAAEYVRDRSVSHRSQPGALGLEAGARHPKVVEEIEGIIDALRDARREEGTP